MVWVEEAKEVKEEEGVEVDILQEEEVVVVVDIQEEEEELVVVVVAVAETMEEVRF